MKTLTIILLFLLSCSLLLDSKRRSNALGVSNAVVNFLGEHSYESNRLSFFLCHEERL